MTDLVDYQQDGVGIKVRLDAAHDTVWLRQEQMGELFGRERSVITKHLRNIFAEGELEEESNVQNLHIAGSDKPVRFRSLPPRARFEQNAAELEQALARLVMNRLTTPGEPRREEAA